MGTGGVVIVVHAISREGGGGGVRAIVRLAGKEPFTVPTQRQPSQIRSDICGEWRMED